MVTQLLMVRDQGGAITFGLPFSSQKYSTTLAANVEQTLAVPAGASKYLAIFSFTVGTNVWVANNETATVAGASFAATDSEFGINARQVSYGDTLHFITIDSTSEVGVTFYAIS